MKAILMIAFHYPPCRGSSGLQRTLSFSRCLPAHGWTPVILSASPRAYPEVADDQLPDVPANIPVVRAFALDTARHLAWRGRYLSYFALPDRWVSWSLSAVWAGMKLIRQHQPAVLWSTHPIPTAHLIGLMLHRLTGIPWIADFRDPLTEIDPVTGRRYPGDSTAFKARRWVERLTIAHSARSVFVAPATLQLYRNAYADMAPEHWALIPNGYDEDNFLAAEPLSKTPSCADPRIRLLHSGSLYTADRDPSAFFSAVARLRDEGRISPANLEIILRATGHDDYYRALIGKYRIADLVTLAPAIPYREALAEMLSVHGLLILQGQESNANIPAKLYEYLRARRPILALIDPEGDTARELHRAGVGLAVPLRSETDISRGLLTFLQQIRTETAPVAGLLDVKRYSRQARAQELAQLCDRIQENSRRNPQTVGDA